MLCRFSYFLDQNTLFYDLITIHENKTNFCRSSEMGSVGTEKRKEKKYRMMWNVCAAGYEHWERYARKKSVTFFEAKRTIV